MKLSAPIYRLKRDARLIARDAGIPLHEALDRVARQEGYESWSLLAAKAASAAPAAKLYARLRPGDLLLVGARPGHGKTVLSLELAVEAMTAGHRAAFFTLAYTPDEVMTHVRALGLDRAQFDGRFTFDTSEEISADHIATAMADAPQGTLVVVDFLQLLDQKRENPDLMTQVRALRALAQARGLVVVFVSQIDRAYDPAAKPLPDLDDVRLPNPLDLALFDKTCFLNNGELSFQAARA